MSSGKRRSGESGKAVVVATTTSCCTSRTGAASPAYDPSAISAANGTRNLIDAASHSAWRTAAAFLRNASVMRPIAAGEQGGLPEMIGESERVHDLSFLASFRSVRSASWTSSSVSLPASIRCATTGCVRPPKKPSNSSISRRCAVARVTCGSKM